MEVFDDIYATNFWRSKESVSGAGSTLLATEKLRYQLPALLNHLSITSMLDIPVGDYHWMKTVDLGGITYIGADVVGALIEANKKQYPTVDFRVIDITKDPLPPMDLIFCRDLLGHFSNADVRRALNNIRESGARYLAVTTFPDHPTDGDIETGQWRPINLDDMFGMPEPILRLQDTDATPGFNDKCIQVYDLFEEI